eukprot:6187867-Pleurochrysis_carterae.AAC.2
MMPEKGLLTGDWSSVPAAANISTSGAHRCQSHGTCAVLGRAFRALRIYPHLRTMPMCDVHSLR